MWFWEVIWQDKQGNQHSLFSLQGYEDMNGAFMAWQSCSDSIKKTLKERKAVLVIDEQIVYRQGDELYPPDEVIHD